MHGPFWFDGFLGGQAPLFCTTEVHGQKYYFVWNIDLQDWVFTWEVA